MAEENKVTLHGFWASPFTRSVELALKLKGIPYGYVEEDFSNKSQLLLKYNPVHKKVPVLVHNGKPIVESLIILEYIDETWKNAPKLLPEDPHMRSQVRFWAIFLQQQVAESLLKVLETEGETQEIALKQVSEKLNLLEEGLKSFYPDGNPCIDIEHVGLHDLVLVSFFGGYKVYEELLGIKLLDPEKTPLIYSSLTALADLPLVKETLPPHEKVVALLKSSTV
ncbi:hypothetical protein UlMin_008263 [Ulmus minor]